MSLPRVVVINDDPGFLDLVQDLVTDTRSYEVEVFEKGLGAVERLKEISPDVIVLDVRLEYDRLGSHVLEGIRRNPILRRVPVIVCTADSGFLERHQVQLKRLQSDWIEKPFDIDDLLQKIDRAIANAGAN